MSMPSSTPDVSIAGIGQGPTAASTTPGSEVDQELLDWDAYHKMLLAGQLNQFAGQFIVIHEGNVIARGTNLNELRDTAAAQLGIAAHKVVIPFVDSHECIMTE